MFRITPRGLCPYGIEIERVLTVETGVFRDSLQSLAALFLLSLAVGCASVDADLPPVPGLFDETLADRTLVDGTVDGAAMEEEAAEAAAGQAPLETPIIYGNFPVDVLNRVILAEMAGQRGFNQRALNDYLSLARETRDIGIVKRAFRIAVFMQDNPAAIEMGNLWLEQEPDSLEALRALSLHALTAGRYRAALNHMVRLLELGEDVDFRRISSRAAADENANLILEALIEDFETLHDQYPDNPSLRLSLALLHQRNGQLREAYEQVRELALDMDGNPEVVILEVQLLELLGEENRARRRLRQSLRNNENHKQLRFLYARSLVSEQRYDEAREQFSIIVERYPEDYEMLYSLALLNMETGLLDEAKGYFLRLVDQSRHLDDAHYYLGYINAQEQRHSQAIEHFSKVNGGDNFFQAQRSLAELMVRAGRYPEAKKRFQDLRFHNPDYDTNINLLLIEANVLMDEGLHEEAATFLNNAVGAFPNNIQLLYLRSVLSQERNDLALMEQDLRQIIRMNPDNPVAYNSLGYVLADRTDRFEEAHELILRAIELAPDDPAIIDSLGWVQYRLGLYEEARENLDRAYALYPDHEVAAHLGEVLWVLGDKAAAHRIWRKALEERPDSEYILDAMERLAAEPSS